MDLTNSKISSDVIDMEGNSNSATSKKTSVKSYAERVFQESTIGMVSSIVTTHSIYRRSFKTFLFLFCISGFLYQCITFLRHVFEYPTVVDIDIERPENFNIPAYTFCTNNPIKRSIFCNIYPDRCYTPSVKFCERFEDYCGVNKTVIPWKKYYELENSMSNEDILKYGDDLEDFYVRNRSEIANRAVPDGPYIRLKEVWPMKGAMICYSLHSVVENNQPPAQKNRSKEVEERIEDTLVFYVDESEMLIPGNRPGILFSIHSPFENVNPFEKGFFLKAGRTYKIFVEMEEEVLLTKPFETDCVNYEEMWAKNNHSGPRIQQMCQHKCFSDFNLEHYKCVHPYTLYPSDGRICDFKDIVNVDTPRDDYEELDKCLSKCKDDCRLVKYTAEAFERFEVDYSEDEDTDDFHRYIKVEIYLKDSEVVIMKHSPKYLFIEVFSNLGGFAGCWLGIALMDVVDVFGSIVTVCRYAARKKQRSFKSRKDRVI